MKEPDLKRLTSSQEDSLASLSALPGSEAARTTTVISGLKCCELYGKSGPLGSLVRMCLASSIWHSTRCCLTWKAKATKSNRLLFQLAVSTHRTGENGCAFWPTPTASSWGSTGHKGQLQKMLDQKKITEEEFHGLIAGNEGRINPQLTEWLMGYREAFTRLMPTPRASDWKGSGPARWIGGGVYRHQLIELLEATPRGVTGRLNPEWIEWFMGYPIGWTELEH